ncbi:FAD-dependent oxidoreductase [Deinococcus altitudinis]|uniref:FAD-dependent oxidoreductase n=1 Tax=Deinococcus altitudinis TaxID=468914 RepID=UPI003891E480
MPFPRLSFPPFPAFRPLPFTLPPLTTPTGLLLLLCSLWNLWLLAAPSGNDLLVYGGTPQGVMAAVAAAQQGQRVVLVVPGHQLGGVLTRSWLTTLDMSTGPNDQPLSRGLFLGLYRQLHHDNSFDVAAAQRYFNALVRRPGLRVLTDMPVNRVSSRAGRMGCPLLGHEGRSRVICAARYIDASDNAELAAQAGAGFTVGRDDEQQVQASQVGSGPAAQTQMAAGLIFRVRGLDWSALYTVLNAENSRRLLNPADQRPSDRGLSMTELLPALNTVSGRSVVGLARLAHRYRPSDPGRFVLRGFNGARQDDGSLLVNALLILNVNGTSPAAARLARQQAEAEARRVVAFLRRAEPGVFGHATFGGVAPELYVRESRHLIGEYRLHAEDVVYGRRFPDGVAVGGYPLDGQQYRSGETPYLIGHPSPYEVPLSSLIPQGFSNLLVVSQAASFDSVAAFSARVVPLQMNLGEAAGLAAAVASQSRSDFPSVRRSPLLMLELRNALYRRGNLIRAPSMTQIGGCRDAASPEYPTAVKLLRRGLMSAPYYYLGCLNLADGETGAAFLGDLQHGLSSAALKLPERQPTFEWLRTFYASAPQTTLERSEAQSILRLLKLPADSLSSRPNQTFTRAEAALLRSELLGSGLTDSGLEAATDPQPLPNASSPGGGVLEYSGCDLKRPAAIGSRADTVHGCPE